LFSSWSSNCSLIPSASGAREIDGLFIGPKGTCYEAGLFRFHVVLPPDYPESPPTITCRTKIFHPNINDGSGAVCIDVLNDKGKWQGKNLFYALTCVIGMLTNPNPDSPLNKDAASLYLKDNGKFNQIAGEWTRKYAAS